MAKKPLKILIFGDGNLGRSLQKTAKAFGMDYHLVSRERCVYSDGFSDPADARMVINTIGGSLSSTHESLWRENIDFNLYLMREYPSSVVFAFSSNSALEPWRSLYGSIKKSLEDMANASENLYVIRVSSLYGHYKPSRCFPWKLQNRYRKPSVLTLPSNPIQPTPTDWLALKLLCAEFSEKAHVFDMAPRDSTTPAEWGQKILGSQFKISSGDKDMYRNHFRILQSEGSPSWLSLWNQFKGYSKE